MAETKQKSKATTKRLSIVVGLVVLLCLGIVIMNHYSRPATALGIQNGKLAECPDKPNCVCSQSDDPQHRMPPIPFTTTVEQVTEDLTRVISEMPRSRIVEQGPNYLRVEFRSLLLRFVDDAEFMIDQENKLIHFRSASRVGYSDMGINKKRIEFIKEQLK